MDDANPVERWDDRRRPQRAAPPRTSAAYIGELESTDQGLVPITNDAGIVQVSPGASGVDLTSQPRLSVTRALPPFPAGSRCGDSGDDEQVPLSWWAAGWACGTRPGSVRVVFDVLMQSEFEADAAEVGIQVSGSRIDRAGSSPAAGPSAWKLTDGQMPSPARSNGHCRAPSRRISRRFDRRPGPYAAYGFGAMRVAWAIGGRSQSLRLGRRQGTRLEHPDSILSSYSITSDGDTTLCAVQRYRLDTLVPGGRCPRELGRLDLGLRPVAERIRTASACQ
jgi:hypothetical protein